MLDLNIVSLQLREMKLKNICKLYKILSYKVENPRPAGISGSSCSVRPHAKDSSLPTPSAPAAAPVHYQVKFSFPLWLHSSSEQNNYTLNPGMPGISGSVRVRKLSRCLDLPLVCHKMMITERLGGF